MSDIMKALIAETGIQRLGKRMQLRQAPIATAMIYYQRFYVQNRLGDPGPDPLLVAVCCLYLACKIEECPQHIQSMCNHAILLFGGKDGSDNQENTQQKGESGRSSLIKASRTVKPSSESTTSDTIHPGFPYTHQRLADMEFYLLETLGFQTIVFHPYRPLRHFVKCLKLEETFLLQAAWCIVNDSFFTDIPLMYPPHIIAVAAIMMASSTMEDNRITRAVEDWVTSLVDVPMKELRNITETMLEFYDQWSDWIDLKQGDTERQQYMKMAFETIIACRTRAIGRS